MREGREGLRRNECKILIRKPLGILPRWCLHLNVLREYESYRDPESYAGGSVATGRDNQAGTGQRVEATRRERPWPSRLGIGRKASTLAPEKFQYR